MGYKVKWVEDNLGISRKALRNYEKFGLMPENKDGRYRDYSDEDIDRIWAIRIYQGMGYSLSELVDLTESDKETIEASLEKKIRELEEKKAKIEEHIGYAQAAKFTGRIPARPKNMGDVTFDEFHKNALSQWNVNATPEMKKAKEVADLFLNTPDEALTEIDIGKLLTFLIDMQKVVSNWDLFFIERVIPYEILKRKDKGPSDEEVQLLIKMLYDNRISMHGFEGLSKEQFVRFESSSYISGDIARFRERECGKNGCLFIADAIAIFGGYSCYDEVED